MNQEVCVCCRRHCPMNDLHCETGREYARTGVVKEKHHRHHSSDNVNDQLAMKLRHLSKVMNHHPDKKGGQIRVLMMLNRHDGMSQKRLTEHLELQPGSVSELISKLEASGYVVKEISEEDRRNVNLYLTEEGKKAAEQAKQERKQKVEEMFVCLDEQEKNQLLQLLGKLEDDWHHRYGMKHHGRRHKHSENTSLKD